MKHLKKNILLLALLFLCALILTYSNHFENGFHFDDIHAITENVHITDIKNIPAFFVNPKMFSSKPDHWGLRPIVTTSLAIDYWLGNGLNPFYFHISTFLWYMILCILLFFTYHTIYKQASHHAWVSYFAIIGCGWYALHTANAETINYIISRSDVLSALCVVASVCIYILFPKHRKWHLYIIPAIIGVFVKEIMAVVPILLFFYTLLFEKELSIGALFKKENFKTIINTFIKLIPITLVILALQLYTLSKAGSGTGFSNPPADYILTQPFIWVHYFISFFIPLNLSADTDWTVFSNRFDDRIIIGIACVLLLIYTIFKTSKKKHLKPIAYGLLWFSVCLLPTSIAPLAEVMNDHRMFLPFIGLTMTIVYSIGMLVLQFENKLMVHKKYLSLLWATIFMILTSYAYGTYQRNKVWKNDETLWHDVTIKSPKNGRGLMNYGLTLMEKGQYDKALTYYHKALYYTPNYSLLHINIAIAQGGKNNLKAAEQSFKKAIQLNPYIDTPYYFYAEFLNKNKRYHEAREIAEKAHKITPYNLNTQYVLMHSYLQLKLFNKLEKTIEHTLKIAPDNAMALKYQDIKKQPSPKFDHHQSNTKNGYTAAYYINASLEYFNNGQYTACIKACEEALLLDPNNYIAYNNICSANNALGAYSKAKTACEKAIEIKPDFELATNNLDLAVKNIK